MAAREIISNSRRNNRGGGKGIAITGGSILLMIVLITAFVSISTRNVYAQQQQQQLRLSLKCHNGCVIFRLDDIQGWWEHDAQVAVLDTFIQTQTKATPALVMNKYGNETSVVDKVKEGQRKGFFEVALHGWNHDDYGAKTLDEQSAELAAANNKLETINGGRSNIFVAPYDSINSDTPSAMKAVGLQILSADLVAHNAGYIPAIFPQRDNNTGITSVPFTVNFVDRNRPVQSEGKTVAELIEEVKASIAKHGFAVVVAHPQDFALYDTRSNEPLILPQVNDTQTATLKTLISELKADGKTITSFNELTGFSYPVAEVNDTRTTTSSTASSSPQSPVPGEHNQVVNQGPTATGTTVTPSSSHIQETGGISKEEIAFIVTVGIIGTSAALALIHKRQSRKSGASHEPGSVKL